ncbi:hypothetical protein [Candidatus Protochlamydia phocaeensis]|uniref:hypothetical protein n=1 Tax=Candidatus Protochlamydia phocaeensis TaxID=1414722 RepID=UPI000838126E|nr:hypothetical protein [Candidatus Protochlamydia phocaeensis]
MAYIATAYYTENTGYEEEIQHLKASLEHFDLPMDLVGIPTQGSWQANTQYKPYFIKQMLIRHYPKDILYLDADARVQQYPALFDHVNFDLGVFYWKNKELISSTLYFANNAKVFELVERWITCSFENADIWDQKVLQYVIQESKDLDLRIYMLPPTYCKIFDLMQEIENPVIEQFQASRRLKKEVDEPETEGKE